MKPKKYIQPNYDSVEEMIEFLRYGCSSFELTVDSVFFMLWRVYVIYGSIDLYVKEVDTDLKTALRKCCEERIRKGL